MTVDTSMIDAQAFYSQYVTITSRKWIRNRRSGDLEMYGSCPWCPGSSTDSFMFTDTGRYSHLIRSGGCGRYGSNPYWFLKDYEGLTHWEACERLDIDPGSEYVKPAQKRVDAQDIAPCKKWQERATALTHKAQQVLWSKRGSEALAYLKSRGLEEKTIRKAQLGYIPFDRSGRWFQDTYEQWGLESVDASVDKSVDSTVWIPEGILIPWYSKNEEIWKLNIRRVTDVKADSPRYMDITGSSDILYNFDAINVDRPVVLQEGAIDALVGNQECEDMATFIATGSAGKGRKGYVIVRLLLAAQVLIAFDDDEIGKDGKRAGDEGAKQWLELIPHAMQWLPWKHDTNDMLKAGVNLREWLALGLETCELFTYGPDTSSQPSQEQPEPTVAPGAIPAQAQAQESGFCCSVCGLDLEGIERAAYSEDGLAFCDSDDSGIPCCSRAVNTGTLTQEPGQDFLYITEHLYRLDQDALALAAAAEPTELEREIMTRLQGYNVFLGEVCSCGCRLKWPVAGGTWIVCARCEPGGMWSGPTMAMIRETPYRLKRAG